MTTPVQNSLFYSGFSESSSFEDKTALDKDAFLKLMITKLKNQDPLEPMDDQQMMTQMTQYSTVEQLANINQQLTSMLKFNQFLGLSSLIGKEVEWTANDGISQTAIINSVTSEDGNYHLILESGEKVTPEQITLISK